MPLPSLSELRSAARVVTLPMTTTFRGVSHREALLLEGPNGWGEFSPFLEYDDAESAHWLAAAIEAGWEDLPAPAPDRERTRIPVNATLPAVAVDRVAGVLARYEGCRTVKVKVAERGQVLGDDVARVREVRRILGPAGRIRIDANGAWNVDEAEHAVHALAEFDLEYVEQPCASVDELAELRTRVKYMGIPIAADESVRKAEDPLRVARAGAADILVVKVQPLGGVRRALQIVAEAGLPAVVSSALDTSVGLGLGATLAAALPELDYDCGLGTGALFEYDVRSPGLLPSGGSVSAARVTPDAESLRAVRATAAREDWWLARLERCHDILAS